MSKQQMRLRYIEGGEGSGAPAPPPTPTPAPTPDSAGGDEPLGEAGKKALDAERAANKELRAQLKALEEAAAKAAPPKAAAPKQDPEGSDLAHQLQELQAKFAESESAREKAEISALRTSLASGKLPTELVELLTGTTPEEINDQIAKLAPLVKSGPTPNPQQGTPPGKTGGSIAAGRERYAATH